MRTNGDSDEAQLCSACLRWEVPLQVSNKPNCRAWKMRLLPDSLGPRIRLRRGDRTASNWLRPRQLRTSISRSFIRGLAVQPVQQANRIQVRRFLRFTQLPESARHETLRAQSGQIL